MMRKLMIMAMICLLSLQAAAIAEGRISLGSVKGNDHLEAIAGGEVTFKLLLFNIHETSAMKAYLSMTRYPEGWNVSISPGSIELPYQEPRHDIDMEEGCEYLSLPNMEGVIKVTPIFVRASIPHSAEKGDYHLIAEANLENGEGLISTTQSRRFSFSVSVKEDGHEEVQVQSEESPRSESPPPSQEEGENKTEERQIINETYPEPERYGETEEENPVQEGPSGFTGMLTASPLIAVNALVWTFVIVLVVIIWRRR